MLDFNDAAQAPTIDPGRRRDELRADLLAHLESVLYAMFPAGKTHRGKFFIGDIHGSPGDSLEVVLGGEKAGLWTDRADNSGGDMFALIGGHYGIDARSDFPGVLDQTADLLGRSHAAPTPIAAKPRRELPIDDLGPITASWRYLDAAGSLIAVVDRHDPPGRKKEFRPWDPIRRRHSPPDPRPLYNQPGLVSAAQVVLAEGEKCAQALIDAGVVATTAMHGANAPVEKTDWSPLASKAVLIWPDKDKPGWEYAEHASRAILRAGAISVAILYPPQDKPEGWDAADAIAEGFQLA